MGFYNQSIMATRDVIDQKKLHRSIVRPLFPVVYNIQFLSGIHQSKVMNVFSIVLKAKCQFQLLGEGAFYPEKEVTVHLLDPYFLLIVENVHLFLRSFSGWWYLGVTILKNYFVAVIPPICTCLRQTAWFQPSSVSIIWVVCGIRKKKNGCWKLKRYIWHIPAAPRWQIPTRLGKFGDITNIISSTELLIDRWKGLNFTRVKNRCCP